MHSSVLKSKKGRERKENERGKTFLTDERANMQVLKQEITCPFQK